MALAQLAPRGDGHPVLVLPGLVAGDGLALHAAPLPVQPRLRRTAGAQGRSLGPRDGVEDGMLDLSKTLADKSGQKVSVIGWSLGGVYARLLASAQKDAGPQRHHRGSPFSGSPRATNGLARVRGRLASGQSSHDPRRMKFVEAHAAGAHDLDLQPHRRRRQPWRCSLEKTGPAVRKHRGGREPPEGWARTGGALCSWPTGWRSRRSEWKPFNRGMLGPLVYRTRIPDAAPEARTPQQKDRRTAGLFFGAPALASQPPARTSST